MENKEKFECDFCKGTGYAKTFNTQKNVEEIQKCDSCMMYETDKEAKLYSEFVIFNELNDKRIKNN